MAEIGNTYPTLVDLLSRQDPDGSVAKIMEVLNEQNPIIGDAFYVPCNDGTKHRTTIRTGIPEPAFRKFNAGVQPSKTTTVPVEDTTGMLRDYSVVDKELADLSGNAAAFRASEAKGIMEGFNQKVANDLFYGSTATTPEGFMGLSPRYSDTTVASGDQIVDAGGVGSDNASVWFVTWGERSTHLIYPKGSMAGLQHQDLGEDTQRETDGSLWQVYRDYFKWDIGLTVRDWRGNARVANIDVSNLTKDAASGADLIDLMVEGSYRLNSGLVSEGKTCIYANRTICSFLHRQAMNKSNVNLTFEDVIGPNEKVTKRELTFNGMPIRRIDALTGTEAQVS